MARIATKALGDVTPGEFHTLKELTLWPESGMNRDIIPISKDLHEYHLFIARMSSWLNQSPQAIVGWATVFPFRKSNCYYVPINDENYNSYAIYLFINPLLRSHGIGKQLYRRVRKFIEKHNMKGLVFPWDDASDHFYDKCLRRWPSDKIRIYPKDPQ